MLLLCGLAFGTALSAPAAEPKVSYRNDVQPILKRHCWACHSASKPKGKLNLETVPGMRKGGRNGTLFVAGKPDESLLIESISGPEPAMPQKQAPLSTEKIDILRKWIEAGAPDDSPADKPRIEIKAPATYTFAPAITSVAWSIDGKRVAAACRGEVVILDVESSAPPLRLPTASDLLTHVEFSPDGKVLAAAGGAPGQYGEVRFLDAASGKLLSARRVGKDTLFRGNFAPDSKAIALGGADGAVHVVPVDEKQPIRRFELHSDWVLAVAYTPDGKMLVTAGRDKATKVANAQSGELLRTLDNSTELISGVAADNLFALSAGRARSLITYELKIALAGIQLTGGGNDARPINRRDQYARPIESQAGEVLALAISGDHKLAAVAGNFGEVRVYRIANRQRVALVGKVPAPVYAVSLNTSGSRLALGSKSGLVQLYELPSGKLLKSLVPVPVAGGAQKLSQAAAGRP
ncbi:MAG TPA: c-type cytochrome domain-containing protein [Gemmataceae bacterium]|nr:c-type cytochrome domain-containing protein [Gemmataceae bacterium]